MLFLCLNYNTFMDRHTKKKFSFFLLFFPHWNLCSTPSVPQQERTLFFSPSLFVSLLTYQSLLVGLQVNGMHTKRKRKGAYKEQEKTQRAKINRFPLKLTLDKLNLLACLLPSSLVLNMQLCRIVMKEKQIRDPFCVGIEFVLTLV